MSVSVLSRFFMASGMDFCWANFCPSLVLSSQMILNTQSGQSGVTEGLVFFPLITNSMNLVLFFLFMSSGNQLLRYLGQTPQRCVTPSEAWRTRQLISLKRMVLEVARGKQYLLMTSSSLQMAIWLSLQIGYIGCEIQLYKNMVIQSSKSRICGLQAIVFGATDFTSTFSQLNNIFYFFIITNPMSPGLFLLIITLGFLLTLVGAHAVQQIQNPEIQVITAYLNQAKSINIPFQKCFKAEPELDANLQYLDFSPTRIGLSTLKSFPIKNEGSHISAFEQLRNPNSFKHRNLLVFDNYLMVFFAPNVIFILEQSRDGFKLKNKYFLENLERYDQFKMYKLESKALLVIFNKNRAYLLNQIDYEDYTFAEISSIVHLQETGRDNEFYAAQSLKGLSHYRLNTTTKKIDLVKRYNGEIVGFKGRFNYIVDVNLRLLAVKGIIYALDAEIGLIEIKVADTQQSKILVSHKNCESFDTIGEEHFVLLCQSQGHSTIIEAYRYADKKTEQFKYRKIQPIFQANYLNDLHLTEQFYLVYSYKSIHAFWNTQKNRLPETLETQSQIAVPGLETFALHNSDGLNFLYTIQAGELKKYELRQERPKLLLKSFTPVDKLFKIYMYGSCNDLSQQPEQGNIKACKVSKTLSFKAVQQQYPHEQDVNISASIVIILITAFLLLIWVCLKKYKGMERQARKILENYQKKRKNQHRAI